MSFVWIINESCSPGDSDSHWAHQPPPHPPQTPPRTLTRRNSTQTQQHNNARARQHGRHTRVAWNVHFSASWLILMKINAHVFWGYYDALECLLFSFFFLFWHARENFKTRLFVLVTFWQVFQVVNRCQGSSVLRYAKVGGLPSRGAGIDNIIVSSRMIRWIDSDLRQKKYIIIMRVKFCSFCFC